MLDTLRYNSERQRCGPGLRFILGGAVGHDTGQLWHFAEPPAVFLALKLDPKHGHTPLAKNIGVYAAKVNERLTAGVPVVREPRASSMAALFGLRRAPLTASSQVAPVAPSDLAPSSIEDNVPDPSRGAIDHRLFEHSTSTVERLDHLVSIDDFRVKELIELAEILDGEVHTYRGDRSGAPGAWITGGGPSTYPALR
jgi:hypothetical protein